MAISDRLAGLAIRYDDDGDSDGGRTSTLSDWSHFDVPVLLSISRL